MPAISSISSMEGSSAERSRFRMMEEICAKLATTPSFPDAFITQGKALLLVRLRAHIHIGVPNHLDDHLHSLFRNSQLRHLLYTHTPSPFLPASPHDSTSLPQTAVSSLPEVLPNSQLLQSRRVALGQPEGDDPRSDIGEKVVLNGEGSELRKGRQEREEEEIHILIRQ